MEYRGHRYYERIGLKTRALNVFRRLLRIPVIERVLMTRIMRGRENSAWTKLVPSEYLYPKGSVRELTRNNVHYTLDISDTVDHFIYFGFKDLAFDRIISYVERDSVIIDVGANIGRFTLVFAALSVGGQVIGFEPDPSTFSILQSNVDKNKFSNVKLLNKALGEQEGELELISVNPRNAGMNRIGSSDSHCGGRSTVVAVGTLDRELESLSLARLDIIKIDVEGFEYKVLKGAQGVIRMFRPILFVEMVEENLMDNGSSSSALVSWIQSEGYQLFVAADMREVSSSMDFTNCHFDLICIPS